MFAQGQCKKLSRSKNVVLLLIFVLLQVRKIEEQKGIMIEKKTENGKTLPKPHLFVVNNQIDNNNSP